MHRCAHTHFSMVYTAVKKIKVKILVQQFFYMFARKSALKHSQGVSNDGIKASSLPFMKRSLGTVVISLRVTNKKLWKMLVLRPVSRISCNCQKTE